jgi:formylglycine-generating enzyme required for sulfatase activity
VNKRYLACGLLLLLSLTGCGSQDSDGPPLTYETGIDPDAWALVPAGEFLFGQHEHDINLDYDYKAMIVSVTNAQFAAYLTDALATSFVHIEGQDIVGFYQGDVFRGFRHEEEIAAGDWLHISLDEAGLRLNYDGNTFSPIAGYGNRPMVHVTWFGARAYCEYNNARLPTEVEWEKAARGTDGRPYPWGDEIKRENANYYSSHDVFEKIVGGLGDTTPVGFYNGNTYDDFVSIDSPSPYGLYDMAGNVWEWTGDVYEDAHYRYMRGGSKADYAFNLRVWTRNNARPDYHSPNVGFRCVSDVAP